MKPVADLAPDFVRQQTEEAVIERPLSEIDRCPVCKGAGWLQSDVPLGHPMFGRLIKCSCQREIEARDNARSMRQISRLAGVGGKSIASFETETQEQARAKSIAEAYARDPRGWLVFSGNCGTGKTHLAAGIANDYMERSGRTVIFAVVPDLLDHLRATFDPARGISYDERFTQIRDSYLLVLDDIGTENATPWAREKLYQIINHRYNQELPTIFTTNQPNIAIDERILSRMLDTTLSRRINLTGEDFRRRGDPTYVRGKRK
jgi:DNA replication protein DnaC